MASAMLSAYEAFVSLERIEKFLLTENMPCTDLLQSWFNENILKDESRTCYPMDSTKRSLSATPHIHRRNELFVKHSQDDQYDIQEQNPAGEGSKEHSEMLSVLDLTCKAGNSNEKYLLENVSLQAKKNTLTVITGPVGSGKSTLLASVVGEVVVSRGKIICPGNIAYFPQTTWIFSGTLRDNILFGKSYDEDKYSNVIHACALKEDMERFSTGDQTFVGERGVVLSGGQRARVSLARAVYADADVYLLDDPLSAVDLKIADHIFNHCIRQLLQDKIRVMVTYTESHMKAADQVLVLHKGSVLGKGSFSELKEGSVLNTVLNTVDTNIDNIEDRSRYRKQDQQESIQLCLGTVDDNLGKRLDLAEEDRDVGTISLKLYWDYFRAGIHAVAIIAMIVLFLGTQGKYSTFIYYFYKCNKHNLIELNRNVLGTLYPLGVDQFPRYLPQLLQARHWMRYTTFIIPVINVHLMTVLEETKLTGFPVNDQSLSVLLYSTTKSDKNATRRSTFAGNIAMLPYDVINFALLPAQRLLARNSFYC